MATPLPFDPLGFIAGVNLDDSRYSAADLQGAETLLADALGSRYPSLDLTPGTTLYDLVVRPQALLYLLNRSQNEAALATLSLQSVLAQPALASPAVVDAIVSNWGLKRRPGAPVMGQVRVNVSRSTTYSIPATQSFVSPQGQVFNPTADFLVTPSPAAANELSLYAADAANDQYYFIVPVVAADSGLVFLLATQTQLAPLPAIANLVSAFSFGDFSGGADEETTSELIARLPEGLAAKNRLSRVALRGELREAFPSLLTLSVQGFGDAALQRGADNIFGIKTPGRADVWVRTATALELRDVSLVASQVSVAGDGSATYSVMVPAAASRGHYFAASVRSDDPDDISFSLGGFPILSQTRGFVANADGRVTAADLGAYSALQTTQISFLVTPDDGIDLYSAATLAVSVQLAGLPLIPDCQTFLDDPDQRAAGSDYLVRAVIPCFVALSPLTIYADDTVTQAALRLVIFRYVNGLLPGAPLTVDGILAAVRGVPGVSRLDLPLRLAGRIFCPDDSIVELQSENALVIPPQSAQQLAPETAAFFVALEDIPLNVIYGN